MTRMLPKTDRTEERVTRTLTPNVEEKKVTTFHFILWPPRSDSAAISFWRFRSAAR